MYIYLSTYLYFTLKLILQSYLPYSYNFPLFPYINILCLIYITLSVLDMSNAKLASVPESQMKDLKGNPRDATCLCLDPNHYD